jgi:non-ribosomal peptide synthetase component F
MSFPGLLEALNYEMVTAYENQEYSLDQLVTRLGLERDPGRHPMFDVVYQYINAEDDALEPRIRLGLEGGPPLTVPAHYVFDLVLNISHSHRDITVVLGYSTALFRESTTAALLKDLLVLLERISDSCDSLLSRLDLPEIAARAGDAGFDDDPKNFRF